MRRWIEDKAMTLLLYVLVLPTMLFLAGCLIYDKHAEWTLKRKENKC